jgi:hypothetical protein
MGLYDDLKTALTAVQRLTAAERALSDHMAETRSAHAEFRRQIQELPE